MTNSIEQSIAVLGAGTWGIALARMLSLAGHSIQVWSALPEEIIFNLFNSLYSC